MGMRIHPMTGASEKADICDSSCIRPHAHVREGATISRNLIIGKGVDEDAGVPIRDNVKNHNYDRPMGRG